VNELRRLIALYGRVAARNLVRQRRRTALTLLAIVLGVSGLIIAGGFVNDIFVQLGEGTIHSQLGHLQISRTGYYERGAQRPLEYLIREPGRLYSATEAVPGVDAVMGRLHFTAIMSNGRTDTAALVEGVDPSKEARVGTLHHIVDGRRLRDGDRDGVYVGEGLAKTLKLHADETVTLVTHTADGAMNTLDVTVVGIFRSYSKDYDARAAQIPLATAQDLLQVDGVNEIVVLLDDTSRTASVAAQLRTEATSKGLVVKTWYELSDFYRKTVELFERQFGFLQLVILVLIVLSVLNTVNLAIFERRGEFGTMRALGNSNAHVFGLILIEGALLGIAGSVLGALVGIVAAAAISAVGIPMPPPPNADLGYIARIRLTPGGVLTAVAIGIAATAVASFAPARRVSRMPIVDALRQNV
jgi:putative ABC transport system permease protein